MEQLNAKMDRVIELLEKLTNLPNLSVPSSPKKENGNQLAESNWSVDYYYNFMRVKFSFTDEFKDFVKELGGSWNSTNKSWKFPKHNSDSIVTEIKDRFPTWTFTDLRENNKSNFIEN
jgi:hypothetical protein